jgi:hypothetical protein
MAAVAIIAFASSISPARAATSDTQSQTCPVVGGLDPDSVTLTGPASLSPNHMFAGYSITSSETPAEQGDGAPHGVTVSFSITTIDTPGGSSINSADATPSTGSASGDFATTALFQLRGELTGTARTYRIDWTASFDGPPVVPPGHTCSSKDGTHHAFTISVLPPGTVLPETPLAIALPLGGLLAGGMCLLYRRSRTITRRTER